jgi:hypothetical protein
MNCSFHTSQLRDDEADYPICDSCLHYLRDHFITVTGKAARVTMRVGGWEVCCFGHCFGLPTRKTIRLPRFLVEAPPKKTGTAISLREAESSKSIEAWTLQRLANFVGKNPLNRVIQRMFIVQRRGSLYMQALFTRMRASLDEDRKQRKTYVRPSITPHGP